MREVRRMGVSVQVFMLSVCTLLPPPSFRPSPPPTRPQAAVPVPRGARSCSVTRRRCRRLQRPPLPAWERTACAHELRFNRTLSCQSRSDSFSVRHISVYTQMEIIHKGIGQVLAENKYLLLITLRFRVQEPA